MHVVAGDASSAHLDRKPKISAARHVSRNEREGETPPSKREKKGELAYTACMVVGESVHTHHFYMWRDKKGDRAQTKNPSQTGKKDGEGHQTMRARQLCQNRLHFSICASKSWMQECSPKAY